MTTNLRDGLVNELHWDIPALIAIHTKVKMNIRETQGWFIDIVKVGNAEEQAVKIYLAVKESKCWFPTLQLFPMVHGPLLHDLLAFGFT